MKTKINITINEEYLKIINKKRGLVPLSVFINEIIKNNINNLGEIK